MFLYGASGHAKVIIDIVKSSTNFVIEGVYDDFSNNSSIENIQIIKNTDSIKSSNEIIISIGDNKIRKQIAQKIKTKFLNAIHKTSYISINKELIGNGTVIMPNVTINSNSKIGEHCIINTASVIEHDCIIEDFVHLSPNGTLTGNTFIGEGSHVGAGAIIIPGIKIGKWAVIGAGSIIIEDVPDYAVVVGNPGKIIKYNYHE